MKHCPRCGEDKPLDGFFKNAARHDGLSGYCRECQTLANNGRTAALRMRAIESIGGPRCCSCGITDVRVLTIDHRDGGGTQHRRDVVSSHGLYKAVIKEPGKYQVLCHNCTWIKRHENDEVRLARDLRKERRCTFCLLEEGAWAAPCSDAPDRQHAVLSDVG